MYCRQDGNRYARIILPGRNFNISLAGAQGPLCGPIRQATSNPEWELTETELLNSYSVDPLTHALIIDRESRRSDDNVSLYRLKHIWGYSKDGWTPLALELEGLYIGEALPHTETKQAFTMPIGRESHVYEFRHLRDCAFEGSHVTGTLLFEDAFHSLMSRINRKRQNIDKLRPIGFA